MTSDIAQESISEERFPLLERRISSSSSSMRRKAASNLDARKVLQSRPSGVIGEEDALTDQNMVKKANLRNIFFPFNLYYKLWWGVTVVAAIATSFFLPYEIAFQEEHGGFKDVGALVGIILEVIFSIDIAVNFNLAVYKEGRLIFTRSDIIKNYVNDAFWLDLCGVFPFESLVLWMTGNLGQSTSDVLIFSVLRLPRLSRLRRLKKFSDIMQYDGHVSFLWFTLLRNTAAVLVFAHWEACTMYFIARLHDFSQDTWLGPLVTTEGDEKSTFDLYLTSLYLSVVTFCTVGYGDFSPVNSVEKLVGSVFMLCNIVVAAWIIGSITLLIVKGDEKTGQYRDNLDSLQQYGHMHQFDDAFMSMLKSQLKLGFQNQEISDEQVLKSFPSTVRRKILRKLYLKALLRTQLMKGVRPQFVDAFLASCKVEIFSPGEEIVERGSILSDLFLLVGGVAEVTECEAYLDIEHGIHHFDEDDSMKIRFEAGDFIGEIGFFTESPQVESVTCLTVCKTLTISQTNYKMLENDHPGSIGKILKNLLAKVEESSLELSLPEKLPVLRAGSMIGYPSEKLIKPSDHIYGGIDANYSLDSNNDSIRQMETLTAVKDLIQMHMSKQLDDQTTRLLYAASRGDTATISLICESSFDPNHGDYDNRTALMVASMKGNTEVCKLLLKNKADPNLEDMHGSTALLEAVKNGHEETMKLLVQNGAKVSMRENLAASILCQAVYDGDITFLGRLVQAGVDVNASDYDKRTATHIAAAEGNLSAFRILVKAGATLEIEDRWGNTPVDEARRHGSTRILEFISRNNSLN